MPKIDPYRFVKKAEKEELRPGMTGVYYKDGYLYATDALSLLMQKADYPKRWEGKVIGKDGNVIKSSPIGKNGKLGKPVEVSPPNYNAVIPKMNEYKEYSVNVSELEEAIKKQKERAKESKKKAKQDWRVEEIQPTIILAPKGTLRDSIRNSNNPNPTKGVSTVNAYVIEKIIPVMKEWKTNRIFLHKDRSQTSAIVVDNPIVPGYALTMPTLLSDEGTRKNAIMVWITPKEGAGIETKVRKAKLPNTKTQKPTTMTQKRTTSKAHKSATTMCYASRILKEQKADYQKIFRAEVKKSKDPKTGAKNAGKIYRDRYGATATARWKKALKRAK